MALLAVVSGATFLGINYVDPTRFPMRFACYWLIVLLQVFWLCILSLADIRQTLQVHHHWQRRHSASLLDRISRADEEPRPIQRPEENQR